MNRNRLLSPSKRSRTDGVNIIEVLLALGIFALASTGLFMAMSTINTGIATSMRRDVEAAYANMLMSSVNPYAQAIETAYDTTSTACSGSRCSFTLPNGDIFYYTLLVNSDSDSSLTTSTPATADMKQINLYLYRNATTTNVYRHFRREIAPDVVGWVMGGSTSYYRDMTGMMWTQLTTTTAYSGTTGSVTAGYDTAYTAGLTANAASTPTNITADTTLWSNTIQPSTAVPLAFRFPATESRNYFVELGFNEASVASAQRIFDIYINDQLVTSAFDINATAGGQNLAITKSYNVIPMVVSNVPMIKVRLTQNGGVAANRPRICWVRIRRN